MTSADFSPSDDGRTLRFSGDLTLPALGDLPARLDAVSPDPATLDIGGVGRMDTIGAWIVHRYGRDHNARIENGSDASRQLIDSVAKTEGPVQVRPDATPPFQRVLGQVGDAVSVSVHTLHGLLGFFGAVLVSVSTTVRERRKFRVNAVVRQFEVVGVEALGIVGLMSFLIGIVIAQQGAIQLRQFGADVYTINLVGRLTFRELGVLMTAIMVAGRSGSAFAAQIGSMKLAEEVDAMRTIGVSPMEALVLPRVTAAVIVMPLLGFYAALLALVGGGLFTWFSLHIPPVTFVQRIREVVPMTDVYQGLIKAPVFGLIIAMAGCFQGMQVEGNAEQVGLRTTSAVVQSIFLVIVIDAFFAVFFASIGWI